MTFSYSLSNGVTANAVLPNLDLTFQGHNLKRKFIRNGENTHEMTYIDMLYIDLYFQGNKMKR